ncbi:MAG: YDG domain-containing protein, partial [Agriterribacter sp.]
TATGLVAGNYTCTITDANSCSITKTFTITQPSAISTTASQVNVSCNGGSNGSASVIASGGAGSYTYSWSPSGGTAATATGLAVGNYTCTITDANSCTATRSFTITQPVAMTATTSQTNVACYGGSNGSATVTVSGGTGTKTYSWSPSGGTAATATGLVAGNYTCTITDANSCSITKTFTITQPSAISATASQVNVSCNGGTNGSATVTASSGVGSYTYSWSPSGGVAATATGLAAGNYTCTITDANSCTATRNFTITQPVAMTATTSQTNVACNGGSNGSATVTVSGGTGTKTYSWSPSGGTAATATGLVAGNYTCTITDANSCSITKTFTITQPSAISTTASQVNVSCNGGSNGSATVIASGGVGSYTYSWSPSGGTAATATGLAAGTYTVTVTDANSCTATKNFTITQPTALSVSATKTSVSCNGGSDGTATAAVTGGTGSYTYSWSPSGGTGVTATGLSAGTYTVTVTDANECSATQSVTITEPAKVTVSATPGSQTICSGEQTNIALSSVPSGASFSWSVSTVSGNVSGAAASSGTSIQQTLTGSGVIKYVITPANNTCAGQEKEVVITVNALTNIEMHPADKSIYDEETAKFAIEANNASAYKWQVDAGNGFVDLSDDDHYSGTSSYILKISNAIGSMNGNLYRCVATGNCAPVSSNSAKLTVKVRTAQTISFAVADTKVYGDDNYTPAATTNSGLELNYSSSDESVAEIVSGQIHIKKAGQATITASQPGNDDYKPAASVQQVLTISKKPITVSLAESPAISKVYDTYAGIKLSADNYILKDVETGDDVIVKGTASFEDSNAGDDKTIQVVEFVLNGEQAENYELTTISATVKGAIKRKEITLSLQSSPLISKTYNASATATLAASNYILDGILGEDDVTVASGKAVYSDKKAGADKEITVTDFVLGGAQKDNYTVTTQSAVTSGTIKAKEIILSLADAPAISKVYDGTALATVPEAKYQLQGIETGDDVTVKGTAIYNSKNAGGDKKVTVNEFILNGEDADNYHLSTTELTAEGTVEKATLTVRIVSDATPITKEYDGTAKANISANNYVVEGIVGEDEVVLNKPETGVYENKHGGSEKEVTVSGLQISGEDADNYQLESTTISGSVGKITRKVISVTADSKTKVYGQADPVLTYVAEGKLEGDELPGRLERTAGKNVGNYKVEQGSLTGGDDYLIEWFQNASFTITPAPLTITAEDKAKKQGAANPAFTFSYNGLAEGDQPTDLEAQPVAATNATTGSPIGYYEIEASGAASANYAITYAKGKLTVTPSRGDNFNVKVWSSSPDVLQVRIFTTVAQKSAIILYTETGQQVILQQHQLSVGINSFSVPVGHLASSTYVLSVAAEKFKDAQKVKVK